MMLTTRSLLPLLPFFLTQPVQVSAWGELGHETVGYIAQALLTPAAQSWTQSLLSSSDSTSVSSSASPSGSDLATIAPWADSFRETHAGHFTGKLTSYP